MKIGKRELEYLRKLKAVGEVTVFWRPDEVYKDWYRVAKSIRRKHLVERCVIHKNVDEIRRWRISAKGQEVLDAYALV